MLFDDSLPAVPPRRQKPAEVQTSGAKQCIDRFYNRFVSKFNPGLDPAVTPKEHLALPIIKGGKHGKQFKDLIGNWGIEAVLEAIDTFFTTTDPVIIRSDYTLDYFFMKAQYLRLLHRRIRSLDDRQLGNLDAAARATGRVS